MVLSVPDFSMPYNVITLTCTLVSHNLRINLCLCPNLLP